MKKQYIQAALTTVACLASSLVSAAPIQSNSLIQVRQFENTQDPAFNQLTNFTTNNVNVENELSSAFGGSAGLVSGNLITGKTGAATGVISGDVNNTSSRIVISDALIFDTNNGLPSEVSYDLSFDGLLVNSGEFSWATASVSIYDITGLNTWLDDFDDPDTIIGTTANLVSKTRTEFFVGSQTYVDAVSAFINFDEIFTDINGTEYNFNLTKTGSFIADPDKQYGIQISTATQQSGIGFVDFSNTSTFQFTELNGATFISDSGSFLTQAAVVPIPAAVWLFASGFISLIGFSRRK